MIDIDRAAELIETHSLQVARSKHTAELLALFFDWLIEMQMQLNELAINAEAEPWTEHTAILRDQIERLRRMQQRTGG